METGFRNFCCYILVTRTILRLCDYDTACNEDTQVHLNKNHSSVVVYITGIIMLFRSASSIIGEKRGSGLLLHHLLLVSSSLLFFIPLAFCSSGILDLDELKSSFYTVKILEKPISLVDIEVSSIYLLCSYCLRVV